MYSQQYGPIVYRHRGDAALLTFLLLSIMTMYFVLILAGGVFSALGLPPDLVAMAIMLSFLGSFINIPVYRKRHGREIVLVEEHVVFFGMVYKVPRVEVREGETILAVNLGGAVIPTLVSLYLAGELALREPISLPVLLIDIAITSLVVHIFAKPIRGVGIVVPSMIPPLTASLLAITSYPLLGAQGMLVTAYVSGVLGSLIGADLSNLNRVWDLGSRVVSIGGAGTFDGVFLSGIMAVLLALAFI